MTDLFMLAARHKFRFPSKTGDLTAEQLFDLPLKTEKPNAADLDTVARDIFTRLEGAATVSFVEDATVSPQRTRLGQMLDLVKQVIAVKQAENKAARDAAQRREKLQALYAALAAKEGEALSKASMEDIQKQIAALGGTV